MAGADTSKEDDALEDAKEAFKAAQEHEQDNRTWALEDIRFARLGEQWPAEIERQRRLDARPCLTINRLPSFIRQVVNDARQNKPGIVVHPVDSQADPETADIFNGLIRQIEQSSDAEVAYDTALDFAVTGGFGYFKINTRYACDDTFDQDLIIERVANPFSIYGDPSSTAADSSDWMSAFELDRIPKKVFKARWKDAEAVSFEDPPPNGDRFQEAGEHVTVAAQWIREDVRKQIVAVTMPDPTADPMQVMMAMQLGVSDRLIVDLETYEANQELFQALGMTVQGAPRDVPSWKVTQRILSGADVLEEMDWAGKFIPIIPVYGEELNVEGRRYFRGLVRDAKDPQRMLNYWRTTSTELVALAPRAPFIGRKGAFNSDIAKWSTINTNNWGFVEYDGQEAPQRQPFSGAPAGAIQEAATAADDMKAIIGVFDASLGAQGNETSGRAILARQKEGDVSNFHFIDNLSRAIRHGGRVLLDLIPKVYSTQRVIRIIGKSGEQAAIQIGPSNPQPQEEGATPPPAGNLPIGANRPADPQALAPPMIDPQTAEQLRDIERIYDLTVGKYDLTVQAGPSYSTLREELNTVLMELVRAYPPAAPAVMDIIVKTLDIPDAEDVAQRIEAATQGQQGNSPQAQKQQAQVQAAMDQAHQKIADLSAQLQKAQADAEQAGNDSQLKGIELALKARELDLKTFEAQTARIEAETDAARAAQEAQGVGVAAPPAAPLGFAA